MNLVVSEQFSEDEFLKMEVRDKTITTGDIAAMKEGMSSDRSSDRSQKPHSAHPWTRNISGSGGPVWAQLG